MVKVGWKQCWWMPALVNALPFMWRSRPGANQSLTRINQYRENANVIFDLTSPDGRLLFLSQHQTRYLH